MSAPGWYPDPGGGPAHKYWDGTRWLEAADPAKKSGLRRRSAVVIIVVGVLLAVGAVVAVKVYNSGGLDHDGVYLVGRDVEPGLWQTSGARDESNRRIDVCVWEVHRATPSTPGKADEVGGAGVGERSRVRIRETDVLFSTSGCETWHRVGD